MLREEKFKECHKREDSQLPLDTFLERAGSTPHWHEFIEICYCRKGSYFFSAGDDQFTCNAGEAVLIKAKEPHTTHPLEADSEVQVIHVPVSLLYTYLNNDTYIRYYMGFLTDKVHFTRKFYCADDELHIYMEKLLSTVQERRDTYELQSMALILLVISRLIQIHCISTQNVDMERRADFEKIEPALRFLNENYDREVSLQEIADVIFLSKSAVCKLFRSTMGMPFKEYLNSLRLAEAKRLLVTTTMPITQIASQVGYANVTYFNRVFRERQQISPRDFRKGYKNNIV